MKLLIDIPKKAYETYKEWHKNNVATVEQSIIANGIPYEESSQGEWECARIGNTNFITCSHCKEQFETENTLELWQDEYKFCHRCGADMRKAVTKNETRFRN